MIQPEIQPPPVEVRITCIRAIIYLQIVRDETSAFKVPMIDHGDLLSTICTFVKDISPPPPLFEHT